MRKVLLISLAAVILVGGTGLVAYAQADAPRRQRRPEGREGVEGQRRGPPRMQLTEAQREALQGPEMQKAMAKLKAAMKVFQAKVKEVLRLEDERALRMITMRAIMQQMRPPREQGERPDRRRGEGDRPPRREGEGFRAR
ncbi:MAG: hypothetical protein U9R68_01320 [Planctomycetota bacterium]|nr:hypothetical protein [Planctomycetota bacterium]